MINALVYVLQTHMESIVKTLMVGLTVMVLLHDVHVFYCQHT